MTKSAKTAEFLDFLSRSLQQGDFIRLSLGHYQGTEEGLKNLSLRRIIVKRVDMLSFTWRYKTRDIVKNYPLPEAIERVTDMLGAGFHTAILFTAQADIAYERRGNGRESVKTSPPSQKPEISLKHDRQKTRLITPQDKPWLHALGITDDKGNVLKASQDKYRQINKYVEILSGLLKNVPARPCLRIVDMGSGKGYLTFALYDYLTAILKIKAHVTGVEYRADLVDLCNGIAQSTGFEGLDFVQGSIGDYDSTGVNILIALHACDTATDDAIAKGIRACADLIVVTPCCHKQIRNEMEKHATQSPLDVLLKHGIFMERQAEMVTDGLRALLLEYEGYSTKVFEFISDAHTHKNVMIVASRNAKAKRHDPGILKKVEETKEYFGIETHHLEKILEIGG